MKKSIFTLVLLFIAIHIFSQSPNLFNYQGVIRDNYGKPLLNNDISLKFSIVENESNIVYQEEHFVKTNSNGLINVEIGNGEVIMGEFVSIDWSKGVYYLMTELDKDGGLNYKEIGKSKLKSVPFALFANETNIITDKFLEYKNKILYNKGDLDTINEIQKLELKKDTLFISKGNYVILKNQINKSVSICDKFKYVCDYSNADGTPAYGDGIGDDTVAIQAALDDGDGIVVLMDKHKITATLINSNSNIITTLSDEKSEIIVEPNFNGYKFKSTNNISLKNIKSVTPFLALDTTTPYNKIEVENCEIDGEENGTLQPSIYLRCITALQDVKVNNILINNNVFKNCRVFYAASISNAIDNFIFKNNKVENFNGYTIHSKGVKKLYFNDNVIDGNILSNVCRVMFGTALEVSYVKNNIFKNLYSNGSASVVYSSSGDLFFQNNEIINIRGNSTSHIISDKGTNVLKWFINDNLFDQTLVTDQHLSAIIKGGNNTLNVSNNIFIASKMTSIQYGATQVGKNTTINNNKFIDIEHPLCIYLLKNVENISIKNNTLNGMSNPKNITSSFDPRCRFVNIMNTSGTATVKNVNIFNNVISNMEPSGVLLWTNTFHGGGMNNIKLTNNSMDSGLSLTQFRNATNYPINSIDISFNILPVGMSLQNTPNLINNTRINYNIN